MSLNEQLKALSPSILKRLHARGFSEERLCAWAASIGTDSAERNRLQGVVEPPRLEDMHDAPMPGSPEHEHCVKLGQKALKEGKVALCVLAGGMATRMGGVVKALVEAVQQKTFLDLRWMEHERLRRDHGEPGVPLWLMTSEATDGPIREALKERCDGVDCATFEQFESLRLNLDGTLFIDEEGKPSVYATGHGDLPDALRKSGLLARFIERGGQYVWIANLDNLGAMVDEALLGWHIAHGGDLSVEVVDKVPGDKGGGPVRCNGKLMFAEEFRLPLGFDPTKVPVFSTNTFLVNARALMDLSMEWTYVYVEKKVEDRKAVQFERIINEITTAMTPHCIRLPRTGPGARFLPVKDIPELEKRRPEIEMVLQARGIL